MTLSQIAVGTAYWVVTTIAAVAGVIIVLAVLSMALDSASDRRAEFESCKRQASTPHEYHRC